MNLLLQSLLLLFVLTIAPAEAFRPGFPKEEFSPVMAKNTKLLRAYVQQKRFDKAFGLLDQMESDGYDKSSKEYGFIYFQRAGLYMTLDQKKGWTEVLNKLCHYSTWRTKALITLAYYSAVTPGDQYLKDAERYLAMVGEPSLPRDKNLVLAARWHTTGRRGQAKERLRVALAMHEMSPDASTAFNVGISLAGLKRAKESRTWFERACKDAPSDTSRYSILYHGSYQLALVEDYANALDLVNRALEIEPGKPEALLQKANYIEALVTTGKSRESSKPILESIDEKRCTEAEVQRKYYRLASIFLAEKQYQKALKYATRADTIKSDPTTWELLGLIYFALGHYEKSEYWKIKLCEANPSYVHTAQPIAEVYARQEELDKAINLCTRLLKINPKCNGVLKLRGALLLVTDRVREANADVERLQKLEPAKNHSIDSLWSYGAKFSPNLLQYYRSLSSGWGEIDEMRLKKLVDQIASTTDKNERSKLLQEQSNMELTMCKYEQAYVHAKQSIALGNPNYRIHSIAAASLFAQHRLKEAKAERQIAVTIHHAQLPADVANLTRSH